MSRKHQNIQYVLYITKAILRSLLAVHILDGAECDVTPLVALHKLHANWLNMLPSWKETIVSQSSSCYCFLAAEWWIHVRECAGCCRDRAGTCVTHRLCLCNTLHRCFGPKCPEHGSHSPPFDLCPTLGFAHLDIYHKIKHLSSCSLVFSRITTLGIWLALVSGLVSHAFTHTHPVVTLIHREEEVWESWVCERVCTSYFSPSVFSTVFDLQ